MAGVRSDRSRTEKQPPQRSVPAGRLPEDAIELVIVPSDTYQRARDVAAEQRGGALRSWLMRRNPNPIAAAAHFVSKYTVPSAALVVFAALYSGSWGFSTGSARHGRNSTGTIRGARTTPAAA